MFRIGIKNVLARKLRLITTGLAVILGVGFMAGGLVLTDTINGTFDTLFANAFAGTDAVVRTAANFKSDFGGDVRARIPADLVDDVAKVDGVAAAEGSIMGYTQILDKDGKAIGRPNQGPPAFGVNWGVTKGLNPFHVVDGRAPRADDEVVIDKHTADDGKLHVGDRTKVLTQKGVTDVTVVGISKFGDADTAGGAGFVAFTDAGAQQLVAEPGKYDNVSVVADKGVSQEKVAAAIARALPKSYQVITGKVATKEQQDSIKQSLSFFGTFLKVFAGISLFVGSFIIYNTFSILVAQRRREMALLRAVGATARQVLATLMLEALVVGVIASVLGLFTGIGVAALLKLLLAAFGVDLPSAGIVVTAGTVEAALIVGTVVTVLAAFLPARRAGKVPPIAALRENAVDSTEVSRSRVISSLAVTGVGAVLLLVGLLGSGGLAAVGFGALVTFIGVTIMGPVMARPVTRVIGAPFARFRGVAGGLARENAMRNPKRTARTASALLIGVALVAFIAIVTTSVKASFDKLINDQFTGDLVVRAGGGPGGGVGLSPDLAAHLRKLPQLDLVAALRSTTARFDGKDTSVFGVDAVPAGAMFKVGVEQGSLAEVDDDGFAVHVDKAKKEHWKLGSTVEVVFPETGPKTLHVAAIYKNDEVVGPYFLGLPTIAASGGDQFDQQIFMTKKAGVSIEAARRAVDGQAKAYPTADVQDRKEYVASTGAFINQIVALIYVFLALAVLIALLGIANTLALSVLERTRELGLLRAIGMTKRQLRSAVRYEAVIVALFGTFGGLLVGTFFGWSVVRALSDQGFHVFRIPVGQLVVITVIAATAGVVAAIVPARRAARLDMLKAIATD